MVGAKVVHKTLGEGVIISKRLQFIRIQFADREAEMIFPDAFNGFLTTEDPVILAELEKIKQAAREEQERREQKEREAEEARRTQPERDRALARVAADESLSDEARIEAVRQIADPEIRRVYCRQFRTHEWEYVKPESIDDYYGDPDNEYYCKYCGTRKYIPRMTPRDEVLRRLNEEE